MGRMVTITWKKLRIPNPIICSRSRLIAWIVGFKTGSDFEGFELPLSIWVQFIWYNVWSLPYYTFRNLARKVMGHLSP
jgi:hypothetical protein